VQIVRLILKSANIELIYTVLADLAGALVEFLHAQIDQLGLRFCFD
jgi:hypothetical protein